MGHAQLSTKHQRYPEKNNTEGILFRIAKQMDFVFFSSDAPILLIILFQNFQGQESVKCVPDLGNTLFTTQTD